LERSNLQPAAFNPLLFEARRLLAVCDRQPAKIHPNVDGRSWGREGHPSEGIPRIHAGGLRVNGEGEDETFVCPFDAELRDTSVGPWGS
jgi:hypothetical protein